VVSVNSGTVGCDLREGLWVSLEMQVRSRSSSLDVKTLKRRRLFVPFSLFVFWSYNISAWVENVKDDVVISNVHIRVI
jgi:hypothetical protein